MELSNAIIAGAKALCILTSYRLDINKIWLTESGKSLMNCFIAVIALVEIAATAP